jgi:hypothetical protein
MVYAVNFSAANDLSYARTAVRQKIYFIILDTPTPRASLADSGGWEGPPWGEGVLNQKWASQGVGGSPWGGRGILNPRVPSPPIAPGPDPKDESTAPGTRRPLLTLVQPRVPDKLAFEFGAQNSQRHPALRHRYHTYYNVADRRTTTPVALGYPTFRYT